MENENTEAYIGVTSGMSGHFAVHMWFNPEGFWEPWESGQGRYPSKEEALAEARAWSDMSGIRLHV